MPVPLSVDFSAVMNGDRASCFSLLASGIETGWIPQVSPATAALMPARIPRRIAQYWHSCDLPDEVRHAVENMKAHNPGFEHHLACDESAREFVRHHYGREAARLFDTCFHATMRSDFWRLCWLYENGGLYVDVDTRAHAPLSRIAAGAEFQCLLTYSVGDPWCIDNDFIIVEPRNPLIHDIMTSVFTSVGRCMRTGEFRNVWEETGPGITTIATTRWLARKWIDDRQSPTQTGLVFRRHDAVGEAFLHDQMNYKKTRQGNWRSARPPLRLSVRYDYYP